MCLICVDLRVLRCRSLSALFFVSFALLLLCVFCFVSQSARVFFLALLCDQFALMRFRFLLCVPFVLVCNALRACSFV